MMKKLRTWRIFNFLLPLFFWVIIFSIPYFSGLDQLPPGFREHHARNMLFFNVILLVIFYLHTYVIYPLKDRKNGAWLYIAALSICMAIFLVLTGLFPVSAIRNNRFGPPPPPNNLMSLFPFFFVVMASFCYRLFIDKSRREKLVKERENIHLKTELDFLSSQISPHFLFNTLNTMVSMVRKKSPALESSLISLSQLMRYMLYDTNGNHINLLEEIQYLKSYINLQTIRFQDDVQINLKMIGDFQKAFIAPMLLIAFIENAFKHGIGSLSQPVIDISITLNKEGNSLTMIVVNTIGRTQDPDNSAGIGLNNVKRRLELLYPGQHLLQVKEKGDTFMVMLLIDL
ncbi:MAG: sensor histidine kinase [Bacteroidia bacterium]